MPVTLRDRRTPGSQHGCSLHALAVRTRGRACMRRPIRARSNRRDVVDGAGERPREALPLVFLESGSRSEQHDVKDHRRRPPLDGGLGPCRPRGLSLRGRSARGRSVRVGRSVRGRSVRGRSVRGRSVRRSVRCRWPVGFVAGRCVADRFVAGRFAVDRSVVGRFVAGRFAWSIGALVGSVGGRSVIVAGRFVARSVRGRSVRGRSVRGRSVRGRSVRGRSVRGRSGWCLSRSGDSCWGLPCLRSNRCWRRAWLRSRFCFLNGSRGSRCTPPGRQSRPRGSAGF